MAGHYEIKEKDKLDDKEEQQAIRKIFKEIRNEIRALRDTDDLAAFEAIHTTLPRNYHEEGDTSVTVKQVNVPETMVWGGRASVEIHWRGVGIRKVYLVA